jgi:hypothetical protein
MATWHFDAQLTNHTVPVPPEVAAQLRPDETVHVVLLAGVDAEEADWQRLAFEQFLNGYAPGDDIYDELPAG